MAFFCSAQFGYARTSAAERLHMIYTNVWKAHIGMLYSVILISRYLRLVIVDCPVRSEVMGL